jgi:tetratricopeptide (TPR) repeat protein
VEGRKAQRALRAAVQAFEAERYADAARGLASLSRVAPDVAEVRELHGLALYRLRRWRAAAGELEAFRSLAGTTEQNPVLADCYRGLRRWADVAELWEELAVASPSAPLVVEGRIVAAGALADQGDVRGAVALLAKGWRVPTRPQDHHLRRAYALGDLYERSGDLPAARRLFRWVLSVAPDFVDTRQRVATLR